jgi:hypothetical protein
MPEVDDMLRTYKDSLMKIEAETVRALACAARAHKTRDYSIL